MANSTLPWSRFRVAAGMLLGVGTLLATQPAAAHPLDAVRALGTLGAYFTLGVEHILTGYDHLLFLLGLIVAARRVAHVLWAISAFTLAHSLTLALSVFGVLSLNPVVVEALIALSIAYVGLDNLRGGERHTGEREGQREDRGRVFARYALTFGFGLVHGCGFAGALQEIGLPPAREFGALALFNLGVEAGQLLVLGPVVLVIWRLRRVRRAHVWAPRVVNAALIAVGLYWTAERAAGPAAEAPVAATTVAPSARPSAPARAAVAVDEKVTRWVQPLCEAFQTLPRQRRAECAGERPGALLTAQCTRLLGDAVREGTLTFAPEQAERCVSAMQARYQGCEWAAAASLPPVAECSALLQGRSPAGATCHSSLECAANLHCQGVGPLDAGVCAPPAAGGKRCGVSLDPLAAYVAHDAAARPECAGSCVRGRCTDGARADL